MVNITNLVAVAPKGLWEWIITVFNNAFLNYALAIIMLTLVIKLLMTPTDYLNKMVTRKNTIMQTKLKPELDAINTKYASDPNLKNQKTSELYKKNGYNMGGSCVIMLVNLVLVLAVFFTLFAGLNNVSAYKIVSQYEQLEAVYDVSYSANFAENSDEEQAKTFANNQVALKYDEIEDKFLWIKNVWIADSPLKGSIPTFDEYKNIAKTTKMGEEYKSFGDLNETELETVKNKYEQVMSPLRESKGVNGYFILTILAVGTSLLTQLIASKKLFKKKQPELASAQTAQPQVPTNKIMLVMLPLLMGYIALSSNSVFAIYIVTSQLFGCLSAPIIDKIQDSIEKKKLQKEFNEQMKNKGRIVR